MKMRTTRGAARGWLVGVLVTGAALLAFHEGRARAVEPAIPPGAQLGSWQENGHGGRYLLQIAQGRRLAAGERVAGIVTSDNDCQPEAQGLSHCHNAIDLANGSRIVAIDTHAMMRNRCLAPGDRITLSAIGPEWVLGTLQ